MKLRNYIHNLPSLKGNLIYGDGINLDVDVKLENADSFNIWLLLSTNSLSHTKIKYCC